ncbi:MAG: hypothetical protein DMG68_13475 [Acidobacteria bacterium]|nr:MAG: hypothetical protein DMG68_13475 [Acidobacteriota bacterium]
MEREWTAVQGDDPYQGMPSETPRPHRAEDRLKPRPFEAARQQLFGKRKAVSLQAIKLVSQKNENRTGWAQVQVLRASVSPWLSKQEKGTAINRASSSSLTGSATNDPVLR